MRRARTPLHPPARSPVESLESRLLFAAGDPDPSFAGAGYVTADLGGVAYVRDVTTQPDGKVIVAGMLKGPDQGTLRVGEFLLVRYNADGSRDATFGRGGVVTTDLLPGEDEARGVAVALDGKLYAVGVAMRDNSVPNFAIVRYNPDGSLDATFGDGGKTVIDVINHPEAGGAAVRLQPGGKIVVAGGLNGGFYLTRFNLDGTVDQSFGDNGEARTYFHLGTSGVRDIAFASDGTIVAGGDYTALGGTPNAVFARYTPDGRLDTTFSGDGRFFGNPGKYVRGVAVQPDRKIVVAVAPDAGASTVELRRIKVGGGYDPSFGNLGAAPVPVTVPWHDSYHNLARQSDSKLVVGGSVGTGSAADGAVVRFTPNGRPDATFGGGDGIAVVGVPGGGDFVTAVEMGPTQRIVGGGETFAPSAPRPHDAVAYRLFSDNQDPPPPPPPPPGDVFVEAEDTSGAVTGAVFARNHAGYTGEGFIDFTANRGASVTWNVNDLPGPGNYLIDFRYANGSPSARTLSIEGFPGNAARNVVFPPTGSWSTWRTVSVPMTLVGGGNALSVSAGTVGQNGPNLDSLTARRAPATGARLEAEDAALVGAKVDRDHPGYTGTGYADFTNASGDSVEWTFNFSRGTYNLVVRYANGSTARRPLRLTVNGRERAVLDFDPTGGWSNWREVGITVDLVQGVNRVKLEAIGSSGGNIDSLTVTDVT